jgi:NifU-like protein involved in Fe-S cluster formation
MKQLIVVIAVAALAGCGVEVATTAATSAAIKAKQVEQAKNTLQDVKQKLNDANELARQREEKGKEADQ